MFWYFLDHFTVIHRSTIVGREFLTPSPYFVKTPYIAYLPPFLNFVQSPLALPLFVALLLLAVCVFMQYLTCYYTTSLCCVFYATRYKIY